MIDPAFPIGAYVHGPRALIERKASWRFTPFPVRYGLFEHPREGLILVDTGYTEALFQARGASIAAYRRLLRPRLDPANLPAARLASLGATTSDVRHVILTHLHADHVCGAAAFTRAAFHVTRASLEFLDRASLVEQHRQALYKILLPMDFKDRLSVIDDDGQINSPGELGAGYDIFGDGSCLVVPLPGHMTGHAGVLWPQRARPLLYGADVAWTLTGLLNEPIPPAPLRWILADRQATIASARKLSRFAEAGGEIVLCHDPVPGRDGSP